MTSTLLSCSITCSLLLLLFCLGGLLDLFQHDLTVAAQPIRHRHELLPLGLVDAHPATTLMILRCDRQGWQETTQGKILHMFVALLDLLTGHGQAFLGDSAADA